MVPVKISDQSWVSKNCPLLLIARMRIIGVQVARSMGIHQPPKPSLLQMHGYWSSVVPGLATQRLTIMQILSAPTGFAPSKGSNRYNLTIGSSAIAVTLNETMKKVTFKFGGTTLILGREFLDTLVEFRLQASTLLPAAEMIVPIGPAHPTQVQVQIPLTRGDPSQPATSGPSSRPAVAAARPEDIGSPAPMEALPADPSPGTRGHDASPIPADEDEEPLYDFATIPRRTELPEGPGPAVPATHGARAPPRAQPSQPAPTGGPIGTLGMYDNGHYLVPPRVPSGDVWAPHSGSVQPGTGGQAHGHLPATTTPRNAFMDPGSVIDMSEARMPVGTPVSTNVFYQMKEAIVAYCMEGDHCMLLSVISLVVGLVLTIVIIIMK